MAAAEFSFADIDTALAKVGIAEGDTVIMHSSLLHLGMLSDCEPKAMPGRIVDRLLAVLGSSGTLAALAPCYDYSNDGVPFDTRTSPVSTELGVISANLAARSDAERSSNPIFALAAVGAQADYICNGPNASAFGAESAWDRAVRAGAKILLLGSSFERLTLVRYIEQCAAVPYLYVKMFRTPVLRDGRALPHPVTALLRYAHLPLQYDLSRFEGLLRDAGLLRETALGGGRVCGFDAAGAVRAGIEALADNIHYFLAVAPAYDESAAPLT